MEFKNFWATCTFNVYFNLSTSNALYINTYMKYMYVFLEIEEFPFL